MRIAQLEIQGFRGIKNGRIVLPRHCALLGSNDVGKSSIAESIALLAGKDRLARPICDWDFFGGAPDASSRFDIIATITDFGDGRSQRPNDFPDWFTGERSATPVWWHEPTTRVTTEPDPPTGALLAAQIALTGAYDEEVSEFETIRYFYDGKIDPFTERGPVPARRRKVTPVDPGVHATVLDHPHDLRTSGRSYLVLKARDGDPDPRCLTSTCVRQSPGPAAVEADQALDEKRLTGAAKVRRDG